MLRDLVPIVVDSVDRKDGALLLGRMSSSRLGRAVRRCEFDVLQLRIAGCRVVVSMEESAHFGGSCVCKGGSLGVAGVGLGPEM